MGREFKFKLNFHEKKLTGIFFALEPREELQTGLSLMDGSHIRISEFQRVSMCERHKTRLCLSKHGRQKSYML